MFGRRKQKEQSEHERFAKVYEELAAYIEAGMPHDTGNTFLSMEAGMQQVVASQLLHHFNLAALDSGQISQAHAEALNRDHQPAFFGGLLQACSLAREAELYPLAEVAFRALITPHGSQRD